MKKSDFSTETEETLKEQLLAKREELRTHRFNLTGTALRDVKALRASRREIARTLTELARRRTSA